jgi:3D (Asp-Asp-Asp) domain-containing protein
MVATIYNTAECKDFPKWSVTGKYVESFQACTMNIKGFYEQVRCQGSGTCDGQTYNYATVSPTDKTQTGPIQTASGTTPTPKRTIAVNDDYGTNCYIPYGSKVQLDFGKDNPWNGVYIAEDTGKAITGCRIDVYVGSGKEAITQATRDGLGKTKVKATIIEQGNGK